MKTTEEVTIESIATEASKHFIRKTRDDGETYYCCDDTTPEWITDMVYEAHGDKLPDDYVYNWIDSVLSHIADGMTEDDIHEYIDSEVDCYTSGLTTWLNSRNDRIYYLTQALEEHEPTDGFNALAIAQYEEIQEVFLSVLNSIQERLTELS